MTEPVTVAGALSQFRELSVLEEDVGGEGPRTPTMSRAVPVLQEALRLGLESDYALIIQFSFYFLACAATYQEQPVRAARLWGAAEGMEEAHGVHISPAALSFTGRQNLQPSSAQATLRNGFRNEPETLTV